jgi:hypothetical protein
MVKPKPSEQQKSWRSLMLYLIVCGLLFLLDEMATLIMVNLIYWGSGYIKEVAEIACLKVRELML